MDTISSIFKYLNVSPLMAVWGTDYDSVEKWIDANKMWGQTITFSPSGTLYKGIKGRPIDIVEYIRKEVLEVSQPDVSTWIVRNSHYGLASDDMVFIDLLIELYKKFKPKRRSMIFVGPPIKIHPAIKNLIREFYWPALDDEERIAVLRQALSSAHSKGKLKNITPESIASLSSSLEGLSLSEINELMAVSYLSTQGMSLVDKSVASEIKAMKDQTSLLYKEKIGSLNYEQVIGFDNIERQMALIYRNITGLGSQYYGQLPVSANFLVYGYSGTGKTAFARYFCAKHSLPCYSLRMSLIRNENFGESEKRFEQALTELNSICSSNRAVLLVINEFEKFFSLSEQDNTAQKALIVKLLDYLNGEKPANLLVYATANRLQFIKNNGEEMLRRFNVYFSGLPGYENRKKIIESMIEQFTGCKHGVTDEDIEKAAKSFSRSDPATMKEQILRIVCECGDEGRPFTGEELARAASVDSIYKRYDPYADELQQSGSIRTV
ncbi:MAG: ATP-binding protein [Fibrobacteres bacterium]|nr:ATP-binding protein [Fibrobacterota bacterium]